MKVKLAAIGVGNRTGKYLQYFQDHSDQVELVAIVEPNAIRREACRKWFSLPEESCFESAEMFFGTGVECDGVITHHRRYQYKKLQNSLLKKVLLYLKLIPMAYMQKHFVLKIQMNVSRRHSS